MENIAELEFEALESEKRDRMNSRLQVWGLLISLSGGLALAGLQSGTTGYAVALFPLLAACLARFTGHSEGILDKIKKYLLKIENDNHYSGYESFNAANKAKSSGGHKKALRDAILCIDLLATIALGAHLFADHLIAFIAFALILETVAAIQTCRYLKD